MFPAVPNHHICNEWIWVNRLFGWNNLLNCGYGIKFLQNVDAAVIFATMKLCSVFRPEFIFSRCSRNRGLGQCPWHKGDDLVQMTRWLIAVIDCGDWSVDWCVFLRILVQWPSLLWFKKEPCEPDEFRFSLSV